MSAAPHLLLRLRRWWLATCWRSRVEQLDLLISRIEADLEADTATLHACRHERRMLAMRLEVTRLAQQRRHRPEIAQ
jgi:hypothetical protein